MSAFTTYIFQEDYDRLIRQELPHCTSDKGGRLFGQWTSTGNPVVHHAMSYSLYSASSRDDMASNLYEKFRVCYIGEWRPVRTQVGNADYNEMLKRKDLCRGGEAPERFLVLDVSKTDVVPFLFERQIPKGMGSLEKLPGKNPFNQSVNVLQQPRQPRSHNNPPQYSDPPAAAAGHWNQGRSAPQFQEAATTGFQWYSGDDGGKKLMKALENFKEIAQHNQVDFSRDKINQDISMSFTDARYGKKWEVKFPSRFPFVGALLIKNADKAHRDELRQGTNDKASKAVKNMITVIHKPF